MKKQNQKIGLLAAISLIVGNMIGAGIFVLPASLAKFGSISIVGWIFTATGALILAKIFSNFSKLISNKSGGPYIYSKVVFGDFIGFLVAWGYWISCWINNAAIAVAIVSALSFFFPQLVSSPLYATITGLSFIWFFTWTSSKGVKSSGNIQIITTIAKIVPLLFVIIAGIFIFDYDTFPNFNITNKTDVEIFPIVSVMTLYAFLGIESATIPANSINNPKKIIPTNAKKLKPLRKKLDTNIDEIIASCPISGCIIKINDIKKYKTKLYTYFLLDCSILFSSINANPIQNIGLTSSIGIKVIIIKSNHRDEPFLSNAKPGKIVIASIINDKTNINGAYFFKAFNSKKEILININTPISKYTD